MENNTASYITVYESIGGHKPVLMVWDEEFNTHMPFQTGFFGYGKVELAIADAKDWAEAEEIEFRI